jgi:Animal haem peroxidase.
LPSFKGQGSRLISPLPYNPNFFTGKDVVAEHELKTNAKTDAYKDYVNPGTLNEFQTAAYRTLHGIIPKVVW